MSISAPKVSNPCKKFIEFSGSKGTFQYWDKESKSNIEVKLPIQFIVLDELSTIKGYSDSTQSGIYSNEVHNLGTQDLHVKTFKGNQSRSGKYADIKADIAAMGGKFHKSIYVGIVNGDNLELANFQLKGAAMKAWIDKEVNATMVSIVVEDCTPAKKGKVNYMIPNWKGKEVSRALMDKACAMDKELQAFFKSRKVSEDTKEGVQADAKPDGEDEMPF